MTRARAIGLAVVLAALAACGGGADGPPVIEIDRSACAHCGMFVSEPRFAAAHQPPGGEPRLFDDIGCLLGALAPEQGAAEGRFWFHDAGSAVWIPGDRAVFVEAPRLRTPMASGLVAYDGAEAAARGAAGNGGRVVGPLPELLKWKRQGGDL